MTVQSYGHKTNGMFVLKNIRKKSAKFLFLALAVTNMHYLYIVI